MRYERYDTIIFSNNMQTVITVILVGIFFFLLDLFLPLLEMGTILFIYTAAISRKKNYN